jgi:hypothetical protein
MQGKYQERGKKQYDNTNRGALFVNDRQREGKSDPDFNGEINIEGKEYYISGWKKETKNGKRLVSLSVKAKATGNPNQNVRGYSNKQNQDNIPW